MSGDTKPIAGPPGEILHPTSSRRILSTAAVMLAAALVVDAAAVWGLERYPLNHGYRVIRAKWALLMQQKEPVDILVLGDSSGNQGVVPAVLGARLGGTALNLCTVADLLAVNDAWMLDRYIRSVGPPKAVVLVHVFDMWGRDHNPDAIAQIPLPFGFWKDMTPKAALSFQESARVALDRYVPIYAQDATITQLLRSPVKTLTRGFDMDDRGYFSDQLARPENVRADAKFQLAQAKRRTRDELISIENREALDALAAMGERHGFDVIISDSPLYEGLWEKEGFRRYHDRLHEDLTAIAATHPRLRILPGPPKTFPAEQMKTVDHAIDVAARAFSDDLAGRIEIVRSTE